MSIYRQESTLLTPVRTHLRRKGFFQQRPEMQFFEYSMDIYGYASRSDRTTAVELKIARWPRAFEQSLVYQLCADFVYMALPAEAAIRVDRLLIAEHGLGLIAVHRGPKCVVLIEAEPSQVIIPSYRDFYIALLTEESA